LVRRALTSGLHNAKEGLVIMRSDSFVDMGRRTVTTVVFVFAIGALSSSCNNSNPTTPSNTTDNGQTSSNLDSKLQFGPITYTDAEQDARGDWLYKASVNLRETGGVGVTVTNVQIQLLLDSTVLGTASGTPMLSMTGYSSRDIALVVAADTQIQVCSPTLKWIVTVQFTDAKGKTASINTSYSGCWDY
jgi:hypothetical protein